MPLIVLAIYQFCQQKLKYTIVGVLFFFLSFLGIHHLVVKDINNYNRSLDTLGLLYYYDLITMSYYTDKLLIPDKYLKEEYRGTNNHLALSVIKEYSYMNFVFEWFPIQDTGILLLDSSTAWQSGMKTSDVFPIYFENFFHYAVLKYDMTIKYLKYFIEFFFRNIKFVFIV